MDSQRVEVLHITHRNAVVITVTDHFVFNLLPALERLFHKDLPGIAERCRCHFFQFTVIGTETGTQASKCIRGPHYDRISYLPNHIHSLRNGCHRDAARSLYSDFTHHVGKTFPVFSVDNGFYRCAKDLHTISFQNTVPV